MSLRARLLKVTMAISASDVQSLTAGFMFRAMSSFCLIVVNSVRATP